MTSGCSRNRANIPISHPDLPTPKTDDLGTYYEAKDVAKLILKQYETIEQCKAR